tara:strand:- start:13 stop:315 length:303 start_codon:yes stop_codon:yes gene_type:complete
MKNITNLLEIIRSRKNQDINKSYTASLMDAGIKKCIDKLHEEFSELTEALNKKTNIVHESADLIYHLLVTLEVANIKFEDVLIELEKRQKQSGIEEKNNR